MPRYTYLPFLKTRAGEIAALRNLSPGAAQRVLPVFHVVQTLTPNFGGQLAQVWAGRRMSLDGTFNFNNTGSTAHFASLFATLGGAGVQVTPCIPINGAPAYTAAASQLVNQFSPGLILRATPANLSSATQFAQQQGWAPNDIDLVLDAGHMGGADIATFAAYLLTVIPGAQVGAWRSFTLTGSSAPKDFGDLALGTSLVPRAEWSIWRAVVAQQPSINYGDYSIAHRDLTEPPGYAMARATVSVRYTVDDNWVMIKGRSIGGQQGIPMPQQYRQHAQALCARADFDQLPSCWADTQISAIAGGAQSPGGRREWVGYGHNRHLELVCDRLP